MIVEYIEKKEREGRGRACSIDEKSTLVSLIHLSGTPTKREYPRMSQIPIS